MTFRQFFMFQVEKGGEGGRKKIPMQIAREMVALNVWDVKRKYIDNLCSKFILIIS